MSSWFKEKVDRYEPSADNTLYASDDFIVDDESEFVVLDLDKILKESRNASTVDSEHLSDK